MGLKTILSYLEINLNMKYCAYWYWKSLQTSRVVFEFMKYNFVYLQFSEKQQFMLINFTLLGYWCKSISSFKPTHFSVFILIFRICDGRISIRTKIVHFCIYSVSKSKLFRGRWGILGVKKQLYKSLINE